MDLRMPGPLRSMLTPESTLVRGRVREESEVSSLGHFSH